MKPIFRIPWTEDHRIFSAVVEGDMNQISAVLAIRRNDVNMRDDQGMSPLHYAADRGLIEVCQLLIDNGAEIDALDLEGQSPLDFAIVCEHGGVIQIINEASLQPRKHASTSSSE